jgi:hypothetical protein
MGEMINEYRMLFGKQERKRPIRRQKHTGIVTLKLI